MMDTNDIRSGKLVSIEANLEDGSAIDISNDGSSLSTGSLIKLNYQRHQRYITYGYK